MRRAAALTRAAEAALALARALRDLAREERGDHPSRGKGETDKPRRRRGVRLPADSPTVVDEVTAKRAQAALRRAGIVTR